MMHRLLHKGQKSVIAVAPREETEAEGLAAEAFAAWLVEELEGPERCRSSASWIELPYG